MAKAKWLRELIAEAQHSMSARKAVRAAWSEVAKMLWGPLLHENSTVSIWLIVKDVGLGGVVHCTACTTATGGGSGGDGDGAAWGGDGAPRGGAGGPVHVERHWLLHELACATVAHE